MIDPQQSYWSQMPTPMKICAPLTIIMIAVGAGMMRLGQDNGIILIGTPILIICLRMLLLNVLEIGPQSILGYTYDYWTARVETAYALPKGLITAALVFVILLAGLIIKFTGE